MCLPCCHGNVVCGQQTEECGLQKVTQRERERAERERDREYSLVTKLWVIHQCCLKQDSLTSNNYSSQFHTILDYRDSKLRVSSQGPGLMSKNNDLVQVIEGVIMYTCTKHTSMTSLPKY